MAQKPDGKAANAERVVFLRPAAERISKAVRIVEAGDRDSAGLTFGNRPGGSPGKAIRAATFTGSWAINASKVVTFKYANTATASVTNLSWPIAHSHTVAENCIVGREGTSWWLVVPVLQATTTVFVTDVSISAVLNTTNCTISVGKTLTTATATYLRLRVP